MKIKMDEMEMSINLKAIRISWDFSILFLLGWVCYGWIKFGYFNWIAFILMDLQLLIYWGIQSFLKWNLGRDEE